MSRFEGCITTNTNLSLDEVSAWLCSLPNWKGVVDEQTGTGKGHRRCCKTSDGVVTAIIINSGDHRPGSAASSIEILGSPRTIVFDMFVSRKTNIGRLDDMYKVAFEFCKFDSECSVFFALDDDNRGVFRRQNGHYLVNPDEFYSTSLASYLTFSFETPDSPTRELLKAGWFDQDVNITNKQLKSR